MPGRSIRFSVPSQTTCVPAQVEAGAARAASAVWQQLPERSDGRGTGQAGATYPAGLAGRTAAQDRQAGHDERHPRPAARRLPAARSAPRWLPASVNRVQRRIRSRGPPLELVRADAKSGARRVKAAVAAIPALSMDIVRRNAGTRGFVVPPSRWAVARTFSLFGRDRRLAKHCENLAETLAAFVAIAAVCLALGRLARTA